MHNQRHSRGHSTERDRPRHDLYGTCAQRHTTRIGAGIQYKRTAREHRHTRKARSRLRNQCSARCNRRATDRPISIQAAADRLVLRRAAHRHHFSAARSDDRAARHTTVLYGLATVRRNHVADRRSGYQDHTIHRLVLGRAARLYGLATTRRNNVARD